MDLGPVGSLTKSAVAPAMVNLVAAAMAHRAQNGPAIELLETALRTGGWDGAARWHARDQLAMRWAEARVPHESLRIVEEDIARAEQQGDKDGVVNAVGTLMPLYENLGDIDRSLKEARRFYTLRKELGDGPYTNHAWRAYIEVLFKAKHLTEAEVERDALANQCEPLLAEASAAYLASGEPHGLLGGSCVSDLYYLALTGYWSSTPGTDTRDMHFGRALELARLLGPPSLASVRLLQGMEALRETDYDGASIAFMEARRIFEAETYPSGVGRVESLNFTLSLATDDRQAAFDAAMNGADIYARAHNVHELASLYAMAVRLYVNIPPQDRGIAAYVRAAHSTLTEALSLQYAVNDRESAAEVLYVGGQFLLRSMPDMGAELLEEAARLATETARFDIAALSHMGLSLAAKSRGDNVGYNKHLEIAKDFARLAKDPQLLQNITRAESGDIDPREAL
jgi:hypothetical protein